MSDIYNLGLLGDPVSHSKSPRIHNFLLDYCEMKGAYSLIKTPKENIQKILDSLKFLGFRGVNITVPHKELAMTFTDILSERAKKIGAINTILFREDKKILGENTDCLGFWDSLPNNLKLDNKLNSALIIGAGGSARAVSVALLDNKINNIIFLVRNNESSLTRANELKNSLENFYKDFNLKFSVITQEDLISSNNINIIINTSPVGMTGNIQENNEKNSPLKINTFDSLVGKNIYFYDLVYNPRETEFLRLAKERNFLIQNGEKMLLLQAMTSFSIWTGRQFEDSEKEYIFKKLFI